MMHRIHYGFCYLDLKGASEMEIQMILIGLLTKDHDFFCSNEPVLSSST